MPTYNLLHTNWRWRNNDGGEKTATWQAAQNAGISAYNSKEVIRLRIEIINPNKIDRPEGGHNYNKLNLRDTLQYSTTPQDSGSWKNIGQDVNKAFVISHDSSYVKQDDTTTSQLTDTTSYPFYAGRMMVMDSVLATTILSESRSEYEWSLKSTANAIADTTYYFRQKSITAIYPDVSIRYAYSTLPSLKISTALPVTLSGFTVSGDGNRIKIGWSSASEQNTAYFNVQRSAEGQTWQTINKLNARGNSVSANQYEVYDNSAKLTGTVYYRLAVVDKDGSTSYSSIVPFTVSHTGISAFLYPNPAHDVATLQFAGTAGAKYSVMITDLRGKPVLQKEGMAIQGNNQLTLDVRTLTKGMYIIRLLNDEFSQNLELIKGK